MLALRIAKYYEDRRLDKELILKLARGTYIQDSHNMIFKWSAGLAKTFFANVFVSLELDELTLAKLTVDGNYRKYIEKLIC